MELALQHLSDWMIEERLISSDQWELIRQENFSQKYQYEALLNQLLPIQNPTGFITVRESLSEDGHFSIEIIDNQESERDDQTASGLQGQYCLHLSYLFNAIYNAIISWELSR